MVSISSVANWDASCVLTGVAAGQTCPPRASAAPLPAEAPTSRNIITWNGTHGIPFEWANLTAAQKTTLDTGDSAPINANRLNYLRGDRTNEQNTLGVGLFGSRVSVLADIIDSSPTPVGPPTLPYPPVVRLPDQQPEPAGERRPELPELRQRSAGAV